MKKKPLIVVDARMVGESMHGFARYVTLMARGLSEKSPLPYDLIFLVHSDKAKAQLSGFETHHIRSPFLKPTEIVEIPFILQKLRADFYHSPTFSSLLFSPCPWIITVHDLCHLQWGGIKEKLYYQILLKPFARRAHRLLTVSEFSKKEILAWIGPKQIDVVYNAILAERVQPSEKERIEATCRSRGLTFGKYLFCLSNPKPHKNVSTLIEAYRIYLARKKNVESVDLVLTLDQAPKLDGLHAIGSVNDREAKDLLAGAKALFFPSLYEGFGLPPVEACALGTAVVVSDIPVHREGLEDLMPAEVKWVLPKDLQGWVEAIECAADSQLVSCSSASSQKILDRYSVKKLGEHMDQIYQSVLASKV